MIELDETVVAVVGVAKNCGKTTTLNTLVAAAHKAGRRVGLVSVGVDGEPRDALLGTSKPAIRAHADQLIATTQQLLNGSGARVEYLETLGFTTPLGEAVLARVLDDGEVMLGGMRHRADIEAAVDVMRAQGADQVFIDGAYGRVVAAQPGLSDGVVVATGAVVGQRIGIIVEKTNVLVDRLTMPRAEEPWQRQLLEQAIEEDRTLFGGPELAEPIPLPAKSALVGLSKARRLWTAKVEAVAVPGLVSDRVAQELLWRKRSGTLLLADGTSFQVDDKLARKLRKSWDIRTLESCTLLAIAYNPTSLHGYVVSDEALGQALRSQFPNITVANPIVGLK